METKITENSPCESRKMFSQITKMIGNLSLKQSQIVQPPFKNQIVQSVRNFYQISTSGTHSFSNKQNSHRQMVQLQPFKNSIFHQSVRNSSHRKGYVNSGDACSGGSYQMTSGAHAWDSWRRVHAPGDAGSPFWPKYDRLTELHITGVPKKRKGRRNPLGLPGKMYGKGVVVKTLVKKPKKPNSANRKCVMVRLWNGEEKVAFVPGEGHNLQEHSVVLVRPKKLQDTPGVYLRCVRGTKDLPHVVKKKS